MLTVAYPTCRDVLPNHVACIFNAIFLFYAAIRMPFE
jgi:hypothetical protein